MTFVTIKTVGLYLVQFAGPSAPVGRTFVVPFVKAETAQQRVMLAIVGTDQRVSHRSAPLLVHITRLSRRHRPPDGFLDVYRTLTSV
jgi:hypothetical protein